MTRLSRVPLPRALAHADGEGRLSGGSCASTEGAHGQGHWNGGAAQRHLSTFTTAATTQPSSIAIRKLKSGCTAVAAAAASAAADSAIASFGYSSMTASIMRGVAAAAASAAMAAVRSLKRPVTTVEAEAAAAAAPAAMGGGGKQRMRLASRHHHPTLPFSPSPPAAPRSSSCRPHRGRGRGGGCRGDGAPAAGQEDNVDRSANNAVPPGETEGARLKELREAMAKERMAPKKIEEQEEMQRLEAGGEGGAGGGGAPPLSPSAHPVRDLHGTHQHHRRVR